MSEPIKKVSRDDIAKHFGAVPPASNKDIAQERLYGIRARIESLQLLIATADQEYKAAVEEGRSILKVFPTLDIGKRK